MYYGGSFLEKRLDKIAGMHRIGSMGSVDKIPRSWQSGAYHLPRQQ